MTFLLALALGVWPPALWLWAASRPDEPAAVMPVVLAGAALPFLLAALLREGRLRLAASGARWLCLFLMLAGALFIPKMMWAFRLHHSGLTELGLARAQVERFRAAHGGRAPATLEELGPLPTLRIWTVTKEDADHVHPATSRAAIIRGDAVPPDDGGWGYDPDKGRVFLSCTGAQPKTGSRALHEL